MASLSGRFNPNSPGRILAVILGAIIVLALANRAPRVLLVLAVLVFLGWTGVGLFLGWAGVRPGLLDTDDTGEPADPMTILQQRYASGELTKAEFE